MPNLRRRILTHLVPLRILKGHLPNAGLLIRFPVLNELYAPFVNAIRSGDVSAYDRALETKENILVAMDLWLVMERAREVCLRGLFRRVYVLSPSPFLAHESNAGGAHLKTPPGCLWRTFTRPSG